MGHVAHEWVMSHLNESCHIWMSHGTWINESCHKQTCHGTCEWVMSHMHKWYCTGAYITENVFRMHVWMGHVTHVRRMHLSSLYECVVSQQRMSHRNESCHHSHLNESCHIWMSRIAREWEISNMKESRHTWISHVTHEWVISHVNGSFHTWMSPFTHEWWLSHMHE